jgi:pimeloyl-ACP methyl ester carboxylesterase
MNRQFFLVLILALLSSAALSGPTASRATALYRSGQTFIWWTDAAADAHTKYRVYRSNAPIGDLSRAQVIADDVEPASGNDFIAARIAPREKRTEAPRGFVIRPLGLPLPPGSGLYVHTVAKTGISYYAVAAMSTDGKVTARVLSAGPVTERVAAPEPYLEKVQVLKSGKVARTYIHWSDKSIAYREGLPFKFVVTTGKDVKPGTPAPMILAIHAYSGYAMPSDAAAQDFIVVCPDDFTKGLPFDGYDWWYGYNSNLGGDLTKGVNTNYTERRLLYTMDFARRKWNIDQNRIYLRGSSMGGTGSVAFGLRHPEIFAAIFANVPQVNPAMDNIGWSQQNIEKYCGTRAEAVKTNEGSNVWDRLNMMRYVQEHNDDFPFIRTINARDDQVLKWPQIPGFLKAMNDGHHGFISGWGLGMHNIQPSQVPAVVKDFDIFKIRRNESFPAFSRSSLNDDPGSGDPKEGTITGQMGGGFDWKIMADTTDEWEAEIKMIVDGKAEAVTDITPRRLQQFKPTAGRSYQWSNTDSAGNIIQSGIVTPDQSGLITLSQVKLTTSGSKIMIRK